MARAECSKTSERRFMAPFTVDAMKFAGKYRSMRPEHYWFWV